MVQVINTQHGPARVSVHACLWLLVATLFLGAPLPWRGWAAPKEEETERAETGETEGIQGHRALGEAPRKGS